MKQLLGFLFISFGFSVLGQTDSIYQKLQIDTNYAYFQFSNPEVGQRFLNHFEKADSNEVVIFHYGGSHIQAGRPTKVARKMLQEQYGDGGLGMIFNYIAADSYNSALYTSTKTGVWKFAKSYIAPAKVPLGVCGMSVETADVKATLGFEMKEPLVSHSYEITLFTEIDSSSYGFDVIVNGQTFSFPKSVCIQSELKNAVKFNYTGEISTIQVKLQGPGTYFRFYGMDIENSSQGGIVYHSLGVGAAAMSSILALEKAEQQAQYLNPDIVILDFGTNDIMYHNAVNPKLVGQTERAIAKFKAINPDVIVVLTSTQDLYYKGHYITAGPVFREVMDSIATANNCMFWNWYDCSGGLRTIKTWEQLGYAKSDNVHLTNEGYAVKGEFIAVSIENTLKALRNGKTSIEIPGKAYLLELPVTDSNEVKLPVKTPQVRSKRYTVRSGDTLSEIARKNHTTVAKIKSANKLRSDVIKIGQVLVIP